MPITSAQDSQKNEVVEATALKMSAMKYESSLMLVHQFWLKIAYNQCYLCVKYK